jgi:hypothetical protein
VATPYIDETGIAITETTAATSREALRDDHDDD